jgi:hypothetical protein
MGIELAPLKTILNFAPMYCQLHYTILLFLGAGLDEGRSGWLNADSNLRLMADG